MHVSSSIDQHKYNIVMSVIACLNKRSVPILIKQIKLKVNKYINKYMR